MPVGVRRHTPGLRRHEVAQLAGMSPDYLIRLEQARGPQPSVQMLSALARALRLTVDERNHLFRLAGDHPLPPSEPTSMSAPACCGCSTRCPGSCAGLPDLGVVLVQNRMAVALLGEQTGHSGSARSFTYRWFTDPAARALYPRARRLVRDLRAASDEFTALWDSHPVAVRRTDRKRIVHPTLDVDVDCEVLTTAHEDLRLLVFPPRPGTDAVGRLELLAVVGRQELTDPTSSHETEWRG